MVMACRILAALLVLFSATTFSQALTDEEIFRDFRFNLINPGARSLALGGAFVSLADDATAAQANPSGLSFLGATEYFAEYRYVDNAPSAVTRESLPAGVNTFVATGTDLADTSSPTFLSVVFPAGAKWRLGISRQEVLRAHSETVNSFAFTSTGSPGAFLVVRDRFLDVQHHELQFQRRVPRAATSSASAPRSRTRSSTSVGRDEHRGRHERDRDRGRDSGADPRPEHHDRRPGLGDRGQSRSDLRRPVGRVQGRAVYRRAPKFRSRRRSRREGSTSSASSSRWAPRSRNHFNTPDSYGISVAFQPNDHFTLVQDFEWTEYSDLARWLRSRHQRPRRTSTRSSWPTTRSTIARGRVPSVRPNVPLAFRAGVYRSRQHDPGDEHGHAELRDARVVPGREGQIHGARGIGLVFKQGRLQARRGGRPFKVRQRVRAFFHLPR